MRWRGGIPPSYGQGPYVTLCFSPRPAYRLLPDIPTCKSQVPDPLGFCYIVSWIVSPLFSRHCLYMEPQVLRLCTSGKRSVPRDVSHRDSWRVENRDGFPVCRFGVDCANQRSPVIPQGVQRCEARVSMLSRDAREEPTGRLRIEE